MAWRERNTRASVAWDKPITIEGILRAAAPVRTMNGETLLHAMETTGGVETFFAPTDLAQKLGADDVGRRLRIEYRGEQRALKTGRRMKLFHVFVFDDDSGAPDTPPASDDVTF